MIAYLLGIPGWWYALTALAALTVALHPRREGHGVHRRGAPVYHGRHEGHIVPPPPPALRMAPPSGRHVTGGYPIIREPVAA